MSETAMERGTRVHKEIEESYTAYPGATVSGTLPTLWKCAGHGCPDREPVTSTAAPKCYTCDRPMSRYVPTVTISIN